jgi:uncharacterized phage-associated protein
MALSVNLKNVSESIIYVHRELFEESPSPMKLQKLCYYVQGYSLAAGNELFSEDFQAWQHGPVVYELYSHYKHFQWRQITTEINELSGEFLDFIKDIVSAYGRYDGAALSTMTHREEPWANARGSLDESEGSTELITKESLRNFFKAKISTNG